MPDFWSHHLAADAALKTIRDKGPVWDDTYDNLYYLGAQGPDFFYYINKLHFLTKTNYKEVGNLIHDKRRNTLFENILNLYSKTQAPEVMSYLAGFMTHYLLDVTCHPLICQLGPEEDTHKRVEMDFDALILNKYWKCNPKHLNPKQFICTDTQLNTGFTPIWEKLLWSTYAVKVPVDSMKSGHYEMIRIESLLVSGFIDRLPFKKQISKWIHYDLSTLTLPDVSDPKLSTERQYETFESAYISGINLSSKALMDLEKLRKQEMSIPEFMANYIKYDFLGEA